MDKGVAVICNTLASRFDGQKLLLALALLVCNTARGLASRLARGLALATAAVFNGLRNILGFNGLNSAHDFTLRFPLFYGRTAHI